MDASRRDLPRPSACCAPPLTPPLGLWALCSVGLETVQKKKGIILTNTMRAETAGRNPGIRGRGRYTLHDVGRTDPLVPRRCAVRSRCGPGESGVLYVSHNRTKATCKNSQIKRATAKRPRPACVVCRTAVLRWGARAAAAGPSAIGKNSGRSFARVAHSG